MSRFGRAERRDLVAPSAERRIGPAPVRRAVDGQVGLAVAVEVAGDAAGVDDGQDDVVAGAAA